MKLFSFKGGIHPDDGKRFSKDKAIVELKPGQELAFLLSQHIGAPAKPVVAVGDEVLKGQMIAEASGFVSSPVYSSVSGKVKKLEKRFNAMGSKVDCIVVENDGEYKEVEYEPVKPLSEMTHEEVIQKISNAGVVGMGGAGFPTHVKLSPKQPEKIEYVIANCAECEPYITADYRRMMESPEKLIEGMRVVLSLFENAVGIFGIENNKPDCIAKLEELTKDEPRMKVMALQVKYPQGAERQLIYATTKRAINSTMLPADAGCIVDNVETLIAIQRAVCEGKPLMERVLTISGNDVHSPGNFLVPLGMNHMEVIDAAGGFIGEPEKVIAGGPMMGFSMFTVDTPVAKTSSSVVCMKHDPVAEAPASACINCGRCVEVCPSRIVPSKLADFSERHISEPFKKWQGMECIECGCCSYVCPAKRQLKQSIAAMKKNIIAESRKK